MPSLVGCSTVKGAIMPPSITAFTLYILDLPFKKPFKHAAADRSSSHSIMLKCLTDTGHSGFGESLPREYVTGETREAAVRNLKEHILPGLVGKTFHSLAEVFDFLKTCDGKAPAEWLNPAIPQTAAWAAVELALLDTFGKVFDQPVRLGSDSLDVNFRYSAVFSADRGLAAMKSLLLYRLYGFQAIKLKVEQETADAVRSARLCRLLMGRNCDIRVDVNMAWSRQTAAESMRQLAAYGIRSFEQPLPVDQLADMASLIGVTGLEIMADESLNDSTSLERLISTGGCTSVNVRISKCGGLVAAYNRCQRALAAGLKVQIGCQVGETSLLSAAQLILIAAVGQVAWGEGCFGLHLLSEDPVTPLMQFGYGGKPPRFPTGAGLGVQVDEAMLLQHCGSQEHISLA